MGKKTKSKERLDKYYQMAKEQGYRSRAAFKLIQLNAKFSFLNNCRSLVDLCAAPGGWLQVAERFMPMNTIKIGIDLDPIPRIPGVKTFQEDITTQKCIDVLKKELKGEKADVFLNDGAPNVGANWSKDAHNQNELVLSALKLASMFLRQGGFFVTKVFRSTDFNSLKWVFDKFFKKVEVTKPLASRNQSAETFVVCIGYLAPTFIDEKLFDPSCVFQDTEADHQHAQMNKEITSMDKLMEVRRSRGGYDDDAPMHLFRETTLESFIQADNPFPIFKEFNKMVITEEEREKYLGHVKDPEDLDSLLVDLKVLGKRDVGILLKWRGKIRQYLDKMAPKKIKTKEKREVNSDEQLEKELLQQQRREFKQIRKTKEKQDDQLLLSKAALGNDHHQGEFIEELGDVLEDNDLEDLGYGEMSDDQLPEEQANMNWKTKKELEENLQEMYEDRQQKKLLRTKQIEKVRASKKKDKMKQVVLSDNKFKAGRLESDVILKKLSKSKVIDRNLLETDPEVKFTNPLAGDDDSDIYISDEEVHRDENMEVDPDERVPGEVDDDRAYVIPKPTSQMQKRRKMLGRKKRKEDKVAALKGDKKESTIELVPARTMDDYDIEGLAQTLAIAKKMLRNRNREDIIDSSYSRYAFEDHDELPTWFSDDEKKHNFKMMPITKEQYLAEKSRIQAINARAPKKVMEAKIRKKMKLNRKLKKVKQRAEKVLDQEGVDEYHKMKQVNKMYQKEFKANKDTKKYIVSKRFKGVGGKDSRTIKHVDSRLKKDKRAGKRIKKTRQVHRKQKTKTRF